MTRYLARTLLVVAAVSFACSAHATLRYRREFVTRYPGVKASKLDDCATCHTSAPELNPYGKAWKAAKWDFVAIEKADADGDGAANRAEIDAKTFPGDAKDKPAAKDKAGARDKPGARPGAAKPDTAKTRGHSTSDTTAVADTSHADTTAKR